MLVLPKFLIDLHQTGDRLLGQETKERSHIWFLFAEMYVSESDFAFLAVCCYRMEV